LQGSYGFTFNGTGTTYHGRSDKASDGSYVATEWFMVVYIPIFPIRSFRMRPVSGGTFAVVYSSQKYQMEPAPVHWKQVRNTYLTMVGGLALAAVIVVSLVGLP
jgi:hypothetical protein